MADTKFDKPYSPKDIEEKWYQVWEKKGYFKASSNSKKKPYVIMMPPPNITGVLHMGHALTSTIQDVLIRWKRMSGYNVLWLPGTDHAGIATQTVVEKELAKEGKTRHDLGRDLFLKRVWEWREKYGRSIIMQTKRFGSSCDWSREHFTMDKDLSRAVREVFVRLYQERLIYRAHYLINWCPRCESALSDLEVKQTETQGKLWTLIYPFKEGTGEIRVSTTRPETMLGDTAVAVHPDDDRYRSMIGKTVMLPLARREIPIITDKYVDPAFGTGAVKITPGHDFNDFEIGKRHNLSSISVIDSKGKMSKEAGSYHGLDRFQARKKVLEDLKVQNLIFKEENYTVLLGRCDRCETVLEPRLSTQWFVKTKPLAKPAIEAVRKKKVQIIPAGWSKTYYHWMENIKDWCISRQIWWGHRIPAWYCKSCEKITVAIKDPTQCQHCKSKEIWQDFDVLDTWFSSALWPFSTLGWPNATKDLKVFYPSSVMETGFDIIFFWVARMMMMGIHFMKKPPFQYIYLHAMVRDLEGQKMSKTKGNVIDPLDTIAEYGADALRFTMAALATQGRDVKLSDDRIQGYRNFINKIWNATRFALMNLDSKFKLKKLDIKKLDPVHRWILSRLSETVKDTERYLQEYKINEAANCVYHFAWHEFCDWYIEFIKPNLKSEEKKAETEQVLVYVLKELLKLLHPLIPFSTEELWHALPIQETESIMMASYPKVNKAWIQPEVTHDIEKIKTVITYIRNVRGENNVSPSKLISVVIVAKDKKGTSLISKYDEAIKNLAKLSQLTVTDSPSSMEHMATGTIGFAEIHIPMSELVNIDEEKKRLQKELTKVESDMTSLNQRLSNPAFIERAPKEVVDKEKNRFQELASRKEKLQEGLNKINAMGS